MMDFISVKFLVITPEELLQRIISDCDGEGYEPIGRVRGQDGQFYVLWQKGAYGEVIVAVPASDVNET